MASGGAPFRTTSGTCELCGVETRSDELETVASLAVCARCARGDLEAAARMWRFEERHRQWIEPKTPDNSENKNLSVEITRPTSLDLHATLSRETAADKLKKLIGRGDPKVGEKRFDDLVKVDVELDFEPLLMALLDNDGVRSVVSDLVALGCTIDLGNQAVSANIRNWIIKDLPDMTDVVLATFVLAVHMERFARAAGR